MIHKKISNLYQLDEESNNYIDTSNFSGDTVFPFEPGKNEFGMIWNV